MDALGDLMDLFQIVMLTCALTFNEDGTVNTQTACMRWRSHEMYTTEDRCNEQLAKDKDTAKQWLKWSASKFPRGQRLVLKVNCVRTKFEGLSS